MRFLKSRDLFFYKLLFFLVAVYVFSLLLDYSKASVHPENVTVFIPKVLNSGTRLLPEDLLRGFEVASFELRDPRVRFISNLVYLLNIKLRIWLWNFIPPHPSLSLTWIFSLILSPILFYKLIYNLTSDRATGWIGLSLYLTSTGFLSGILLFFHPGKPLANCVAILCFFLASKITLCANRPTNHSPKILLLFFLLLATLFLGFFTDETAWFIFIYVPVLFPGIFRIKRKRVVFILLYLSLVTAFLAFLTFIAPEFVKHYGWRKSFDFWSYLKREGDFKVSNVILQSYYFISEALSPLKATSSFKFSFFGFFSLYFLYLFIKLPLRRKKLLFRILAALLLFLVFQTAVMTKHLVVVNRSWYYGAMFPIFFSLLLAVLLSARDKPFKTIDKLVLIGILAINVFNSFNYGSNHPDLTYAMALKAWRNRNNAPALLQMELNYPLGTGWLFYELAPHAFSDELISKIAQPVSQGPSEIMEDEKILIPFEKNGKWGYRDERRKVVIEPRFERAESFFENMAAVIIDKKWGFVNQRGEMVVNPRFSWVMYFSEGLAPVRVGAFWGYIDRKGKLVIPAIFTLANDFGNGQAEVEFHGTRVYINRSGQIVGKPRLGSNLH